MTVPRSSKYQSSRRTYAAAHTRSPVDLQSSRQCMAWRTNLLNSQPSIPLLPSCLATVVCVTGANRWAAHAVGGSPSPPATQRCLELSGSLALAAWSASRSSTQRSTAVRMSLTSLTLVGVSSVMRPTGTVMREPRYLAAEGQRGPFLGQMPSL